MDEETQRIHQTPDMQGGSSNLAASKFSDLLDQYAWVLKQVYEFPTLVLFVPLFKDSSQNKLLGRVRVPVFPMLLVSFMIKRHIRNRLHIINRHLIAQLRCLQSTTYSNPVLDSTAMTRTATDAIIFEKNLTVQRANRGLVLLLVLVLVVVIARLMPLGQDQQLGVIRLTSSLIRSNVEGMINATPQIIDVADVNTGIYAITTQTITMSLAYVLDWLLPLALIFVPVAVAFIAKRWMLNHPYQRFDRSYSVVQDNQATKREGIYALEKHVFDTMELRMPMEFQLDLLVYALYFALGFLGIGVYYLWKVSTPWFFGASIGEVYATVSLNVMLVGALLCVAVLLRRRRSNRRRHTGSLILLLELITVIPLFLDAVLSHFYVLWYATGRAATVASSALVIAVYVAVPIILSTIFVFIAAGDRSKRSTFAVAATFFPALLLSIAFISIIVPSMYSAFEAVFAVILFAAPAVFALALFYYLFRRLRHTPSDTTLLVAIAAGWCSATYWLISLTLLMFLPVSFLFIGAWVLGLSGYRWWKRQENTKTSARRIAGQVEHS